MSARASASSWEVGSSTSSRLGAASATAMAALLLAAGEARDRNVRDRLQPQSCEQVPDRRLGPTGGQGRTRVPAVPAAASLIRCRLVIADGRPVRAVKRQTASTFGPIPPAPNSPRPA